MTAASTGGAASCSGCSGRRREVAPAQLHPLGVEASPGRQAVAEMSAMRDMSRAIRHELREHGETLRDIDPNTLTELVEIVGAFYFDLRDELKSRDWPMPPERR